MIGLYAEENWELLLQKSTQFCNWFSCKFNSEELQQAAFFLECSVCKNPQNMCRVKQMSTCFQILSLFLSVNLGKFLSLFESFLQL
jgi:hypothetical protein